mmetsp:Transcript_31398/g.61191  ORF Transcript_31398/g.61191 Transcript_31398/m.61191 type:complete len:290 (+) Transcript_31398:53-922(+)
MDFWFALCAAQAAAWFWGVPHLAKPYWETFWSKFPPVQAELALNVTGFFLFLAYSVVMLPIYTAKWPFFEQFKISDKPWPWHDPNPTVREAFWSQSRKSVGLFLFNFFILVPLLTYGKCQLFDPLNFSTADWPSRSTAMWQLVAMTFLHELGFYLTHRFMHWPVVYRFHKVHHEYKQNNVLASQHNHPIDYIVSIASPALLAMALVNPHSITQFQFLVYAIWTNLDDHVGYAFPWSPVRWFPLANLTEQHEFHHAINLGCFASKLNVWDKLFQSEERYLRWAASRAKKA